MTFYVSCRYFPMENRMYSPKVYLAQCFVGLNFESKQIAQNRSIDGRLLYEITLDAAYSSEEAAEYKAAMIEGLSVFGAHEKSTASAKDLAELLTGIVWTINGSKIECTPMPLFGG